MKLTLIRGLPGSGKSTMAKRLAAEGYIHLEADMFFVRQGEYVFDRTKLPAAHQWCQNAAMRWLAAGRNVVVSNTFVTRKELQPYIDLAKEYGAELCIRVANGCYGSIHNVPQHVIERMKARWENV